MTVVAATERDWERLREVRLAALADDPEAFCAVLEREQQLDEADWRRRVTEADTTWLLAIAGDGGTGHGDHDRGDHGMDDHDDHDHGEVAGGIVGVVAVETVDASRSDLVSFWVRPTARGRGAGTALIEAAFDVARARGHSRVTLEVGDHNVRAQRLYARHGFVPTGHTSTMPPPKDHVTEHQLARDLATS